jgi:hypothetical protein
MMIRRGWYTTLQLTVRCVLAPNFDKYATKLDLFTLFKYNKAVDKELFYILLGGLQILCKVWTDKELQCLRCNCLATPNYQAFGLTHRQNKIIPCLRKIVPRKRVAVTGVCNVMHRQSKLSHPEIHTLFIPHITAE